MTTLHRQCGFSLVELMVSTAISLFLLSGLSYVVVSSSNSWQELNRNSQQVQNGRYAMQILSDELRHAGFFGDYMGYSGSLPVIPDPCSVDIAVVANSIPYSVYGYDSPLSSPLSCIDLRDHVSGTDVLVVRRANTLALVEGSLPIRNDMYIQANSIATELQIGDPDTFRVGKLTVGNTVDVVGTTAAGGAPSVLKKANNPGTPTASINETLRLAADIRKFHTHIYYISPCSIPAGGGSSCTGADDDGGRPVPTLKRLELVAGSAGPTWRVVPLVEGIENMQLDFGLDNVGTLDGTPDRFVTCDVCGVGDWANVMAVRVHILARNTAGTNGHVDQKRYDLGLAGLTTAASDNFKRHAYSALVRVNNVSGRRE